MQFDFIQLIHLSCTESKVKEQPDTVSSGLRVSSVLNYLHQTWVCGAEKASFWLSNADSNELRGIYQ